MPTPSPTPEVPIQTNNVNSEVVLKNFNEINNNFSALTGIVIDQTRDEFIAIQNQLPVSNSLDTFSSFNQIAITRLAFSYCDIMVTNQYTNNTPEEYFDVLVDKFFSRESSDIQGYDN